MGSFPCFPLTLLANGERTDQCSSWTAILIFRLQRPRRRTGVLLLQNDLDFPWGCLWTSTVGAASSLWTSAIEACFWLSYNNHVESGQRVQIRGHHIIIIYADHSSDAGQDEDPIPSMLDTSHQIITRAWDSQLHGTRSIFMHRLGGGKLWRKEEWESYVLASDNSNTV